MRYFGALVRFLAVFMSAGKITQIVQLIFMR